MFAGQIAGLRVVPDQDQRSGETLGNGEAEFGDAPRRVHQRADRRMMVEHFRLQDFLVHPRPRTKHFDGAMGHRELEALPEIQVRPVVALEDLFQITAAVAIAARQ